MPHCWKAHVTAHIQIIGDSFFLPIPVQQSLCGTSRFFFSLFPLDSELVQVWLESHTTHAGTQGGGEVLKMFIVINVFHRESQAPPATEGPKCFSRGSLPVFLRKPIATCEFQGWWGSGPLPPPPPPPSVFANVVEQ